MELARVNGARTKAIVCVLVVIVLMASRVAGEYDGRGSDMLEGPRVERMHPETSDSCVGAHCLAQNSEGPVGAMWFGPRLGRRRRSDNKFSPKKIEALSEMLGSPTWNLVTIPGGEEKRQETTFTPRLGRELENAISVYDLARGLLGSIDDQNEQDQQTPPPMFPPRLGRNLLLTPRLEHELRNLLRKLQMQ